MVVTDMARPRILITGSGAVCGSGNSPAAIFDALCEGRSAVAPIEQWDTTDWPVKVAAEIADFNPRAMVEDRKLHKFIRRTDMLGLVAGSQAVDTAGFVGHRTTLAPDAAATYSDRSGVYVGSGGGAYNSQYEFFPLMTEADGDLVRFGEELSNVVNPMWLLRTLPNNVLCHLGIKYRLKGSNACITNHSCGGTLAVIEAAEALRTGEADIGMIVAHGNGTRQSDASEATALRRVFGSAVPPIAAFKWSIGHLIAAAGIVETVVALHALKKRLVPGVATLRSLDPECAD